jgi:hypothetical protein
MFCRQLTVPTGKREYADKSKETSLKKRRLNSESSAIPPQFICNANDIHKRIREENPDLEVLKRRLSDPAIVSRLPFPFVWNLKPDHRFKFSPDGYWDYMGREKFEDLLDDTKKKTWLYGTIGYGKSHLLAALVCYLTVAGERVVYIPDCGDCAQNPVDCFRAAMLLAWANDDITQEEIMKMKSTQQISRFFNRDQHESKIVFVIDQMNALDLAPGGAKDVDDTVKGDLRTLINACVSQHRCIFSASANYTALSLLNKDGPFKRIDVYGGLSVVSLSIDMLNVDSTKHLYRKKWNGGGNSTRACFPRATKRMNS